MPVTIMNDHSQTMRPARPTIMLVDDDSRVRASLALLLRWSGSCEVIGEAANSASALELAAMCKPDMILLDLSMPDGDGLSLLPRLCALSPRPGVVMLTAEPADVICEQALALGAAGCLSKL